MFHYVRKIKLDQARVALETGKLTIRAGSIRRRLFKRREFRHGLPQGLRIFAEGCALEI